jgi:hypothetical protein
MQEVLKSFKNFCKQQETLHPLSTAFEPTIKPFVFGIGFNGIAFNSMGHHEVDKNEIWIHFSYSRRDNDKSGNLFLAFLILFSAEEHCISSNINHCDINTIFQRYKSLIIFRISSELKRIFEYSLDKTSQSNERIKLYKFFLSQLEQDLSFKRLHYSLQEWIKNFDNWYSIPYDISMNIAEPLSEKEKNPHHISRDLLFDVFCERKFSIEHSD